MQAAYLYHHVAYSAQIDQWWGVPLGSSDRFHGEAYNRHYGLQVLHCATLATAALVYQIGQVLSAGVQRPDLPSCSSLPQ